MSKPTEDEQKPDEVVTRRLVIEDSEHRPRMMLHCEQNEPLLAMFDKAGTPRFMVGLSESDSGAVLTIADARGVRRLTLSQAMHDGQAGIVLSVANGRGETLLSLCMGDGPNGDNAVLHMTMEAAAAIWGALLEHLPEEGTPSPEATQTAQPVAPATSYTGDGLSLN
jgi:hypothetical protein